MMKCSMGYDSHIYCPDSKCEYHLEEAKKTKQKLQLDYGEAKSNAAMHHCLKTVRMNNTKGRMHTRTFEAVEAGFDAGFKFAKGEK